MQKYVVTSGQKFTDIDALACAVAYAELLNRLGKESEVVLPGTFNASITQTIRDWDLNYRTAPSESGAPFVIVDVSDPEHIATCAKEGNIVEVFDHHTGFEDYWQKRIGEKSHIEFIGACATLIWEEYKKTDLEISRLSSNLLSVAIISNTLNFGAQITHQRDHDAFRELQGLHLLSPAWIEKYFLDREIDINGDVATAISNDTKVNTDFHLDNSLIIGQLELWDGKDFLYKNTGLIQETLMKHGSPYWFMTVPSLKETKNYIYAEDPTVQAMLSKALGVVFQENIGVTDKLWLRKEILKKLYTLK